MRYAYPFTVTADEDGRFVVAFPDVRGASTDGADEAEAIENASDCLIAASATSPCVNRSRARAPLAGG